MAYEPGEQPSPDFLAFYTGPWKALLERVEIPGMTGASWDRKAAYLFWAGEGREDLIPIVGSPVTTSWPIGGPPHDNGFEWAFNSEGIEPLCSNSNG